MGASVYLHTGSAHISLQTLTTTACSKLHTGHANMSAHPYVLYALIGHRVCRYISANPYVLYALFGHRVSRCISASPFVLLCLIPHRVCKYFSAHPYALPGISDNSTPGLPKYICTPLRVYTLIANQVCKISLQTLESVSYTHLTLPTNREV